jgi:predicted Zn-dependent protease
MSVQSSHGFVNSEDDLRADLARRAPRQWELYRKSGESRKLVASPSVRSQAWQREEGWAIRWWEEGTPRFACASNPGAVARAIAQTHGIAMAPSPAPQWPQSKSQAAPAAASVEPPPDLFEDVARQLSAESRGEALLAELTLRRGVATERIENGCGLEVAQRVGWLDGMALAVGRRGGRSCEARLIFRWDREPDVAALARRLADRAVLPLSDHSTPVERGEWLLDPSVGAALLAGIAPLFTAARPPRWLARARFAAPGVTIVDDARADAFYDGEGTATRRVLLVDAGHLAGRLHDLRSATKGERSTGHGVRPSYRLPPAAGPRRLFFETAEGAAPLDLLSTVRRGLFASALTAPPRFDLEEDRFELEFTGIVVLAGRAQAPVAGARARGRISQLLRRIVGIATDRQFFPNPYPAGAPTLLIGRADFD